MLISDMPPVPPNHVPVLMAQADMPLWNVVMQDLTPLPRARPDPVAALGDPLPRCRCRVAVTRSYLWRLSIGNREEAITDRRGWMRAIR